MASEPGKHAGSKRRPMRPCKLSPQTILFGERRRVNAQGQEVDYPEAPSPGTRSTFKEDFWSRNSNAACPDSRGNVLEIIGCTLIFPPRSKSRAVENLPQRDPTSLISSTTNLAVSKCAGSR